MAFTIVKDTGGVGTSPLIIALVLTVIVLMIVFGITKHQVRTKTKIKAGIYTFLVLLAGVSFNYYRVKEHFKEKYEHKGMSDTVDFVNNFPATALSPLTAQQPQMQPQPQQIQPQMQLQHPQMQPQHPQIPQIQPQLQPQHPQMQPQHPQMQPQPQQMQPQPQQHPQMQPQPQQM